MLSLQKQAIKSVKWTAVNTVIGGITAPFLLIIKAKYLSPEEFGYLSIITITIGFVGLIENFGISQAIIARDKISIQESSSIFYFNIISSCLFATLLFITAPFIASFFSLPDLEKYLPVAAITFLLSAPSLLSRAFLQKEMYFKQLSLIQICTNLAKLIFIYIFLNLGLGIMGVIYGNLIISLSTSLFIIITAKQHKLAKISYYFNLKKLISFFRFGAFMGGSYFLNFIMTRIDELIIGYFLTPDVLGIYHFGKKMLESLRKLISKSFGSVIFPTFSQLKHNKRKLTKAYHKLSHYIAFFAFPIFTGIAMTAHLFIPLIFGEQWNDSIIIFQVLSIVFIIWVLTVTLSSSSLYSLNKPDLVFYINTGTGIIYIIMLYLFVNKGIIAVLLAYSFYTVFKSIVLQYYANRELTERLYVYLQKLYLPASLSLIMVITVLFFQFVFNQISGITLQLIGSITLGVMVYGLLCWIFARKTIMELKSAIISGDFSINQ